ERAFGDLHRALVGGLRFLAGFLGGLPRFLACSLAGCSSFLARLPGDVARLLTGIAGNLADLLAAGPIRLLSEGAGAGAEYSRSEQHAGQQQPALWDRKHCKSPQSIKRTASTVPSRRTSNSLAMGSAARAGLTGNPKSESIIRGICVATM